MVLNGATGLIAPVGEGAVYFGSNLTVTNAAVLTMLAGTILAINDGIMFTVAQQGVMNIDPGFGKAGKIETNEAIVTNPQGAYLVIGADGTVEVVTGKYRFGGTVSNAGGRFATRTGTTAVFPGIAATNISYTQSGGITELEGNSAMHLSRKMFVTGGTLATKYAGGSCDVFILTSLLSVSGGDIWIGYGANNHYGMLLISGGVDWSGGTYHPFVEDLDGATGRSDVWKATDVFTVGPGATIAPAAIDIWGNPVMPTSELGWKILESEESISATAGLPAHAAPIWGIEEDNIPTKIWYLVAN